MTLKLHPTGLSIIEFGRSAPQAVDGYYVPTDTLNLNEKDRVEVLYSQTKLGGRAISKVANLVDVEFTAFVFGVDRATVLAKAHALNKAVMNPKGGKLEYRPYGATLSTYYYYEASSPSSLVEIDHNKWDWEQAFYENQYVIALEITLKTKPFGVSDVYEAVTPSRTTLQNASYGSYYNYFDLPQVKGDVPALFRLKMRNLQTGVDLSRVYLCTRSSVLSSLSNVVQTLQAETGTGWSTITGGSYSGGAAKQLTIATPDVFSTGLRIPYANEEDHRGLVGVLVAGSFVSGSKLQLGYAINGTEIWRDVREFPVDSTVMHLAYAGEHHLPPMAVPDSGAISNPELVLYVKAPATGSVIIDCIHLIFSDETVCQYDFGEIRDSGITNNQLMVVETNRDNDRVARVTNLSEVPEYYIKSVVGSVFLEASDVTRVFLLFEERLGVYNPYDQVSIEVQVMYRTVYPFGS